MAEVTKTVHVTVVTFDPAQGKLIPVPGAKLLCEDSGILWDTDLNDGSATTDAQGAATVAITFDEAAEDALNPFFTITIPAGSRAVPATAPADRRVELPGTWVTRHYAKRRIRRITDHTDPNNPLRLFVGLPAHLRVAYSDFDASGKRNPLALPRSTARIHLADFDTFIFDFLDFLNPDDTLTGKGLHPATGKIVTFGEGDRYPYGDVWPTVPTAAEAPVLPAAWIDPPGAPLGALGGGSFEKVGRVAVDPSGYVFAIDGDVVRRFYPDGTLAETIPVPSGVPFNAPKGLALDQYANLFVADTGSNHVRVFVPRWAQGSGGRYVEDTPFGGAGNGNGQFNAPEGLAVITHRQVDGPDRLVVADTGNQRVQVLDIVVNGPAPDASVRAQAGGAQVALAFVLTFGVAGAGAGQLTAPAGVAADRRGRVYVADRAVHRVSRWAPDAAGAVYAHEADWEKAGGGPGGGPREFNTPADVTLDLAAGQLYVADSGNNRVQRLDAETGAHLVDWLPPGAGAGGRFTPEGVTVDARCEMYASDAAAPRVVRATRFDQVSGAPLADTAPPITVGIWTARTDPAHMNAPGYLALTPAGRLWVADTGNNRLLAFERDPTGRLAPAPLPPGSDPLPAPGLSRPVGVGVDGDGGVFVVDAGNDRVRRYGADLKHQADLGSAGAGDQQFSDPRGIAIAQRVEPMLYVADRGNNRVQILKRDGTFTGRLTTGGGTALAGPEDVAVDARGNVYVADTGNARVVQYDPADQFVRVIPIPTNNLHGIVLAPAPCGVALDDEGKLLVTDRAQDTVYRLEADGTLLGYWDLNRFLRVTVGSPDSHHEPDLARQVRLAKPARAVVDGSGLLAVADSGNDRVRLARTGTNIDALLLDLGEGQPDISLRAVTKDDYTAELGLRLNVGDVSIFDESQDFVTDPIDDFSDDVFEARHLLTKTNSTNAAVNVMRVVREVQTWYQQHTRADDADHRWATPDNDHTLDVDLLDSDGSYTFLDVNLGEKGHDGKGSDAWDDAVVAHEVSHWVFFHACEPLPPFSISGLFDLPRGHGTFLLTTFNQAINEAWPEFVALSWGAEYGPVDRARGWPMSGTAELTDVRPRSGGVRQHIFGGPITTAVPSFAEPGVGLRAEGYISNALYQLHRAMVDPGALFADSPSFWYRYNVKVSDEASMRFTDTLWKALRRFPHDPTRDEIDKASSVYLRGLLVQTQAAKPEFAELAQTLMELNNLHMPVIELLAGTPDLPGAPLGATVGVRPGEALPFVARVRDVAGLPLRGYHLRFTVGAAAHFTLPGGPGPADRHGRRPAPGAPVPATELHRATDAAGMVGLTFTAPPLPAGTQRTTEQVRVSYQPDFDTDETFAPPGKGDDRDTVLRRTYLHELRWVAKTWSGVGNNLGAEVSRSVVLRVES